MRVTRSFLVLLAVAISAGGCARQLASGVPAAAGPFAPAVSAAPAEPSLAPGIDTTIYGYGAPRAPAPVQNAAPEIGRGLFAVSTVAPPAPPAAVTAPAPRVVAAVNPVAYAPALQDKPYSLDSGDRLRIVVFGQDGLSNSYVVDASGYIAMPLIGSVLARGATTEELSSRISDKLRQGFIREPHVAVEIEAYRPFFILGEVTQPGQYPYVANMTVETAVAIAGGFGPRAYRKTVTVTRVINGQQGRQTVPTNYPLRPGDTVNVGERWF